MSQGSVEQKWNGRWCFLRKHLSLPWNTYVYFRKQVELIGDPVRCVVRISADARYTLYVNGRRVHQGPARFSPPTGSYDTLDLKPYLHEGRNAICAIVHQYGVPTFFSQYRDTSGFLVDGQVETRDQTVPLHTPAGWLCRAAKGWRKDVVRMSIQMGFQEHFDADADPQDWLLETFDAKESDGWTAPKWDQPVGAHPWLTMEQRSVPLLTQKIKSFKTVASTWTGESARGYKISPDVYHLAQSESKKKTKNLIDNPSAMLSDDAGVTTLPPPPDGDFVAAVLDTGTYLSAHLILDLAEASGDEIIDVLYADELDKDGFVEIVGDMQRTHICEEARATRYRCRPGAQRWETFSFVGFRYVAVIFRNVDHPLKVRFIGARQVHADVKFAGAFECSDPKLNNIWETARTTQLNCLFDAFVDCPQREQAQWWGDARVQAKVTAYAFGDASILARGISQLAGSQSGQGELHAHPPADVHHRLPDFMMTWVGTLMDYYQQTGDTAVLTQTAPVLHKLFEFFASHEGSTGLIGDNDGWWLFLDWQNLYKANYSAVLNMMYLQALRRAAEICRLMGDLPGSTAYASHAEQLQQVIESTFWNEKDKLWADGFNPATGNQAEAISQHANTLAILLDLKPETHAGIAKDVLLKSATSKRTKVLTASPFFYAYVLEAMIAAGLRTEAMEVLKQKWGEMLDGGAVTFWETWKNEASRCHAWSASPLYHLSQQILGVIPTAPGWTKVRIQPLPLKLEFAKGSVPTPRGIIKVDWERAGDDQLVVRVEIPDGIDAEFISPTGERRELDPGVSEFQA